MKSSQWQTIIWILSKFSFYLVEKFGKKKIIFDAVHFFRYELNTADGSWVKRVDIEIEQEHVYCCSDTDLYAYDMDGNSLFTFEKY
jgi:hypothetical protein